MKIIMCLQQIKFLQKLFSFVLKIITVINTSLATKRALAHCLQRRTACKIQNGRRGLEGCLPLGFWAL